MNARTMLESLVKAVSAFQRTPIVDDDFPMMRKNLELARRESEHYLLRNPAVDYRDCLELAAALAEQIEKADGSWVYEGDDLPGQFIPVLMPLIAELQELREKHPDPAPDAG